MRSSRIRALVVTIACAGPVAALAPVAADAAAPADLASRIERQLDARSDGRPVTEVSPPPSVTATSWLVHDAGAAEPVAARDPATPRPVASLVKLMTALVAVEHVRLDERITIPPAVNDLGADAARMDARAGERWQARDLLRAMLVHSANDAAIALARHVGDGDEAAFVELMNERASELGMDDTEFASATGLDLPGTASTSTPIDLVALTIAALEHDVIREAVAEPSLTLERPGGGAAITLPNRNPLLGEYTGVDGVKTGFTDAAGYMLVAHHVDEATDGELIVVTFASASEQARIRDSRALLDWARSLRTEVRVIEGGTPYGTIPVQRSSEHVEVFACDDLVVAARVGQRVTEEVVVPRSIAAPVREGDEVGEVRVRIGTPVDEDQAKLPETVSLCSADSVDEPSPVDRLLDYAGDYRAAWRSGVEELEDAWSSLRGQAR